MVRRLTPVLVALACLVSLASTDQAPGRITLAAARKLVESKDVGRIDALVDVIAFGPEADAQEAYKLFLESIDERDKEATALYKLYHATPEGPEKDAIHKRIDLTWEPFRNQSELIDLRKEAFLLVRSLGQADPTQRRVMLKKLAREAGTDWKLEPEDTYWGPRCGSYDHTNEYKILWAAKFFFEDARAVLMDGQWDGRRWMIMGVTQTSWGGVPMGENLDPRLKPLMLKLAQDSNTLVRGQALLSLVRQQGRDVEQALERAMVDPMADTRCKALFVADCNKMPGLFSAVRQLIDDPVEIVRRFAISCAASVGGKAAVEVLLPLLSKKGFANHDAVLEALKAIKDPRIAPVLRELFDISSSKGRGPILRVLSQIDPESAEHLVLSALSDADEDVLAEAMYAADRLKLKDATGAIGRLLSHKSEFVRLVAKRVLEELNSGSG